VVASRLEGELLRADEQQQRRERRRSYHRVMGEGRRRYHRVRVGRWITRI
jgi:hypothetical protein